MSKLSGSLNVMFYNYRVRKAIKKEMRIAKKNASENPFFYASILNNYAKQLLYERKYIKANYYYKEAAKIRFCIDNGRNDDYVMSLIGVALTSAFLGLNKEANDLFKRVIMIAGEMKGKKSCEYASVIANQSLIYDLIGQYKKARELLLQAKDIYDELGDVESEDYVALLNNLGCNYQKTNEHARAVRYFIQAVSINSDLGVEKSSEVINTEKLLAYSYYEMGSVDEAVDDTNELPEKEIDSKDIKVGLINIGIIFALCIVLIILLLAKYFS